jgi:polysaccharide biosynthesis transport protein
MNEVPNQTELATIGDIGPPPEAPPVNPLLIVHRALRGRYIIVFLCAAVIGVGGAAAGWLATKPTYSSQGWIRAFPRQPRVLYETEENMVLPGFDAFVRSQVDLLRSRRVIDLALAEQSLRDAGWPAPPAGVQRMIDSLQVGAERGSELISVAVTDQDPVLAQAAANGVLNAFMRYQEEQDGLSVTDRERRLRDNQRVLTAELRTIRESIARAADKFGGGDPRVLLEARTSQLTRIDAIIADPSLAAVTGTAGSVALPIAPPESLTLDQLASVDGRLRGLIDQRDAIEAELLTASRRLGPEHREIRTLKQTLETAQDLVKARADEVRATLIASNPAASNAGGTPSSAIGNQGAPAPSQPPEPAPSPQDQYTSVRERLAGEIRELSRIEVEVEGLRDREAETQKRLADTNKALEVIRVEDEIIRGGRLRIQQRAATPLQPTKDRRAPLAAAGFMSGAGSVVAAFVGFSLLRRRVRYADDLESGPQTVPLIGVVPDARRADDMTKESISLALHHVRNSLLMFRKPGHQGGSVYLVTSAIQGEGKTTLGIALGASFAQAGLSVTLVDFDFVGRGMTRELGLDQRPGVAEAIDSGSIQNDIYPTHLPMLSAMPAGGRDKEHAHRLTVEMIQPIIEKLRKRSEIVIIDSGPMLGSLEVGLLAQVCDVLVLVSARGTSNVLVNAAIERARRICRGGIAMVFNRADSQDLSTSASYSSIRSRIDVAGTARTYSDRGRLARLLTAADKPNDTPPLNGTSTPPNSRDAND